MTFQHTTCSADTSEQVRCCPAQSPIFPRSFHFPTFRAVYARLKTLPLRSAAVRGLLMASSGHGQLVVVWKLSELLAQARRLGPVADLPKSVLSVQ